LDFWRLFGSWMLNLGASNLSIAPSHSSRIHIFLSPFTRPACHGGWDNRGPIPKSTDKENFFELQPLTQTPLETRRIAGHLRGTPVCNRLSPPSNQAVPFALRRRTSPRLLELLACNGGCNSRNPALSAPYPARLPGKLRVKQRTPNHDRTILPPIPCKCGIERKSITAELRRGFRPHIERHPFFVVRLQVVPFRADLQNFSGWQPKFARPFCHRFRAPAYKRGRFGGTMGFRWIA